MCESPQLPVHAFRELTDARSHLAKVRPAIGQWMESDFRAPNADAIHAARASVARACALLTEASARDGRWAKVASRLSSLPAAMVIEPFGPLEFRGARGVESAEARRDRRALRAVMNAMHAIAAQVGDATLINALAALAPKPPSGRILAWLWRTFGDG